MKNQKGFTIIELGVSIILVTAVAFLLFQMLTTVKKMYNSTDIESSLLTKQAIMTKKIYDELDVKTISSISNCDVWQNSCVKFSFNDGTSSTLMVDPLKNTLTYNNYVVEYDKIDDTVHFGELVYNKENSYFAIKIPVYSNNVNGDFGITIVKQHSNYVTNLFNPYFQTINVPLSSTINTIITNDGNYWLRVYDASNTGLSTIMKDYVKRLKTTSCSVDFEGSSYELRTGVGTSHWCQGNNFYTQDAGSYKHISGTVNGALGKDTYVEALTSSGALKDSTLDLVVNTFIDTYTFKSR